MAAFGPFFAVSAHEAVPDPPWRAMSELTTEPAALDSRIAAVRTALGGTGVEARVAASVAHLGLAARLAAPVLALAVVGGPDPDVHLGQVYWRPQLGGPFPLSLPGLLFRRAPEGSDTSALSTLLDGPMTALADAVLSRGVLPAQVLWGNVASAIDTAGRLMRTARPDLTGNVERVVTAALAHPRLRSAHETVEDRFRRRSCCLVYRVSGPVPDPAYLCLDCALVR